MIISMLSLMCQFLIESFKDIGHKEFSNSFKNNFHILNAQSLLNNDNKDDILLKNENEPLINLITSFPFIQLTFIFFLLMIFNSFDINSIKIFGFLSKFDENFLKKMHRVYRFVLMSWSIISGYLLDKLRFKKFLLYLLLLETSIISTIYFISEKDYGLIILTIITSIINSSNNVIIPISFVNIFEEEKGVLLCGISSILINTFYIYRSIVQNILDERIYFFIFFLLCTVFYMIAIIIVCFFVDKKHIYLKDNDKKKEDLFEDIYSENELDDLDADGKNINNDIEKNKIN
jgi:hypothetical protein